MQKVSKTQIKSRVSLKKNLKLAEAIRKAIKYPSLVGLAKKLSGSTRKYSSLNLGEINKNSKEGETVIVVGKVLSMGSLNKNIKLVALGFSSTAAEKLKKNKVSFMTIDKFLSNYSSGEEVKIL